MYSRASAFLVIRMNLNTDEPVESSTDVANDEWLKENYLDLIQDYPNLWIAVLGQAVVAFGNNRYTVSANAKTIAGGRPFSLYFIEPSDILP